MENKEIENLIRAGKIAKQTVDFAVSFIKAGMPLLEIAEKIESKIQELGGKPAFPVNLSINETAAHSTPSHDSQDKAFGLLKVDIGVHIQGNVADTAVSLDLENSEENKKLIEAAQKALENALAQVDKTKEKTQVMSIGKAIEDSIRNSGFTPIHNLSGHSIEKYDLHSGMTIPNYNTHQSHELGKGIFAIEPFTTSGLGKVRDGKPSGIYSLQKSGNVRDTFSREVLKHIQEAYSTLPFCSRWLIKKFGTRALLALQRLEQAELIHQYPQLIETGNKKVSQAEHTIIITEKEVIVTTK